MGNHPLGFVVLHRVVGASNGVRGPTARSNRPVQLPAGVEPLTQDVRRTVFSRDTRELLVWD